MLEMLLFFLLASILKWLPKNSPMLMFCMLLNCGVGEPQPWFLLWAQAHGTHWSYYICSPPPIPWSSWLDEIVEWPFEDSVTLQAWIKFFQMVIHALNQHPMHGTLSLTVRIHESRNQGVEMGMAQLLYPNDPLAKYFSLFLCPYVLLA